MEQPQFKLYVAHHVTGFAFAFVADFARAAAPMFVVDRNLVNRETPFLSADANGDPLTAAEIIYDEMDPELVGFAPVVRVTELRGGEL